MATFLLLYGYFFPQKASNVENITENEGLNSNYIFSIAQDKNEFIWLGTDKGLSKYEDGKWTTFDTDTGLPGNYINNAVFDGLNGLFISVGEQGLFHFDILRKKIDAFYKVSLRTENTIFRANVDNKYFIINDYAGNKWKRFAVNPQFPKKKIQIFEEINPKNNDEAFMYINESGRKKLVSRNSFKPLTQKFSLNGFQYDFVYGRGILKYKDGKLLETIDQNKGLKSNFVNGIFKTTNNDLLFSSLGGGLAVIKNSNSRSIFTLENFPVRDIAPFGGKIFILSDGYIYVIEDNEITQKYFAKKGAMCFLPLGKTIYVGDFDGLHEFEIEKNKLVLKKFTKLTAGISRIYKQDQRIVLSLYGGAFNVVEKGKILKSELSKYPFNIFENLFKVNSNFAVNSYEKGLIIVDKQLKFQKLFDKKAGLLSNYVSYVFSDNDTVWVGTKGGVSAIVNNTIVQNFAKKDGFSGNVVKTIFRGSKDRIWVVSDKMVMQKKGNRLLSFGSLNYGGNNDEYSITESFYNKEKNQLCFVSKNKFSVIDVNNIQPDKNPFPPELLQIISDGKIQDLRNNSFDITAQNYSTQFVFKSVDRNFFSPTKLYYKVNDDDWKEFREPKVLKFAHLDTGKFKLQIKSVNADGYESIFPKTIFFEVLPPFYYRWWFILGSVLVIIGISSLYIYDYSKRKFQKKLEEIRIQSELELERKRISRDLHDNLGAYTTSLISKVDHLKNTHQNFGNELTEIRENAEYIMSLIRQTIWILNSKETTMENYSDSFKSYCNKYFSGHPEIRIKFIENIENNRLWDSAKAMSVFRMIQEALQNIVKHSEATLVTVTMVSKDKIYLEVKDNGKGFDVEKVKQGNGLHNMRERCKELGFTFSITSGPGGTCKTFQEN